MLNPNQAIVYFANLLHTLSNQLTGKPGPCQDLVIGPAYKHVSVYATGSGYAAGPASSGWAQGGGGSTDPAYSIDPPGRGACARRIVSDPGSLWRSELVVLASSYARAGLELGPAPFGTSKPGMPGGKGLFDHPGWWQMLRGFADLNDAQIHAILSSTRQAALLSATMTSQFPSQSTPQKPTTGPAMNTPSSSSTGPAVGPSIGPAMKLPFPVPFKPTATFDPRQPGDPSQQDVFMPPPPPPPPDEKEGTPLWKVALVVGGITAVGVGGYLWMNRA